MSFFIFYEFLERFEKAKVNFLELTADSKITSKIASFDEKELAKHLEKLNNSCQNLAHHFRSNN